MPDVKACLWNIQNFGQSLGKYNGAGRYYQDFDNALRNRFIARFCFENDIDVLLIQELSESNAEGAIVNLQRKLNALYPAGQKDWAYSWCGSCIASDTVAEATVEGDLAYRSGGRTEGYAVFWRRSQAARFTMIKGRYPIATGTGPANAHLDSPLNISQRGRPTGRIPISATHYEFRPTGGYTTANLYPYQPNPAGHGYQLMNNWPALNYPGTSVKDPNQLRWAGSRRPVYTVVKLANVANTLCPIGAYHAPSNQERSSWGAFIAGLARELYVVNQVDAHDAPTANLVQVTKGTLGGDFNLSVDQNDWPGDYLYFNDPLRQAYNGGANCASAPASNAADTARRTTVQIVTGQNHDQPINSANTNDYLRYKIDLAFFRRNQGITATRVDLLNVLINDAAGVYANSLTLTETYMAWVEGQITNPFNFYPQRLAATGPQYQQTKKRKGRPPVVSWVPIISGAWGGTFTNWAETRRQFAAGQVTDARRAAEFIHIFISDHLPLVVTIPI